MFRSYQKVAAQEKGITMSIPKNCYLSIPLDVKPIACNCPARLPLRDIIHVVSSAYPWAKKKAIKCVNPLNPGSPKNQFNIQCPECSKEYNSSWTSNNGLKSCPSYKSNKIVTINRNVFVSEGWLQLHAWVGICNRCCTIYYSYDND